MPDITWVHTFLDVFLSHVPQDVDTVLDIGCGRGLVGAILKIYREPREIVGIDIFDPYLDFCRKIGVYTELRKIDLRRVPMPFGPDKFDLSVALEVIEHLSKSEGLNLLNELERISRRVIVSTPNKYFSQQSYDGNIHQKHLSRWTVWDLQRRGYHVLGVGNFRILERNFKQLAYVLGRITLPLPHLSSYIMAVFNKNDRNNDRILKEAFAEVRPRETMNEPPASLGISSSDA